MKKKFLSAVIPGVVFAAMLSLCALTAQGASAHVDLSKNMSSAVSARIPARGVEIWGKNDASSARTVGYWAQEVNNGKVNDMAHQYVKPGASCSYTVKPAWINVHTWQLELNPYIWGAKGCIAWGGIVSVIY